jgi:hypothetical protein
MICEYTNECHERGYGKCESTESRFCKIWKMFNTRDLEEVRQRALERWQYEMNDIYLAHVPDRFRAIQPGREI